MASKTLGHNENKNLVDLDEWVQNKTSGSSEEIEEIKEAIRNMWSTIYPVGSIYISVSATNPGTIWGGTWVAWGTGRVPVGVSTGDTEFNTVEKVGGSKDLAAHNHRFQADFLIRDAYTSAKYQNIWYGHNTRIDGDTHGQLNFATQGISKSNDGHRCFIDGNTSTVGTGNSGNLQPYITCYMWKRIE